MRLYDNPLSPYALKVRISLYEKGLDFETHEIFRHTDREALLRVSPRGEVPAVEDGERVIADSRIICEYLEERYPDPPLMPTDPGDRARVRAVELLADTRLDSTVIVIGLITVFRPDMRETHAAVLEAARDTMQQHYIGLDEMLGSRDFLCGPFSRADVAVLPHVGFAEFMGTPIPDSLPRLSSWYRRARERPSVDRAMADATAGFERSSEISDPFFTNERLHWRGERIESLLRFGLGEWLLDELAHDRAFLPPAT
jgi:glutathione S-transferase